MKDKIYNLNLSAQIAKLENAQQKDKKTNYLIKNMNYFNPQCAVKCGAQKVQCSIKWAT